MRLTEIADTPGEQRDELDGAECRAVGLRERLEHRRLDAADLRERAFETAVCHRTADGDDEDREEHHDALDEICARDREEPADERIENDRPRADEDRVLIRDAEHRLEQPPRRDEPRRRIDHEENQDENRGHDAQQIRRIVVAVLEEFRQRERVVGELGVLAQAGGDEMPVRPGADGDADSDPARVQPREIREPRHAHEHPAAHVRRLCRERRHPRAELAVAEEIIAHVARAPIVVDADRHHDADVEHEGIDDGKVMCQGNSSSICDFAMGTMTSLLYKKRRRLCNCLCAKRHPLCISPAVKRMSVPQRRESHPFLSSLCFLRGMRAARSGRGRRAPLEEVEQLAHALAPELRRAHHARLLDEEAGDAHHLVALAQVGGEVNVVDIRRHEGGERRDALRARDELRAHGAREAHEDREMERRAQGVDAAAVLRCDALPVARGVVETEHEARELMAARHAVESDARRRAVLPQHADEGHCLRTRLPRHGERGRHLCELFHIARELGRGRIVL